MRRIIADVKQDWENLSDDHERLANRIDEILYKYSNNEGFDPYVIIGTFGAGKTQLMVHIFKESIKNGLLPIYLLAEDLFTKKASNNGKKIIEGTPEDLKEHVNTIASKIGECFEDRDYEQMRTIINAGEGDLKSDLLNLLQNEEEIKNSKLVLLVDELEGQYKFLKNSIKTNDNSPLREWLDDKSYFKFLSLAPSGVYELGLADESHLVKEIIPPVDIRYIRNKYNLSAGKANALWWLSRGKTRHIIKNYEKIKDLSQSVGEYEIKEALEKLDRIGQSPSEVPAVSFASLTDASKIKYLINLLPIKSEKDYRGFKIEPPLSEGTLSNIFQKEFSLNPDLALKIAHYFKFTAMLLSDDNYITYLKKDEINEFMGLSLDILLENEYKSPVVEKNMPLLLNIYEKIKNSSTLLLTTLITTQIEGVSYVDFDKELPFTIREIRGLFLLPMANPIIKSIPEEVVKEVVGQGKPVCGISENILFFASYRDFKQYSETDEFKDKVLSEGKYLIVLLSDEQYREYERVIETPTSQNEQLLKWLGVNKKLIPVKLSPFIKGFLLSLYGYENKIPFNVQNAKDQIRSSQDPLLQRKFEMWYNTLQELINDVVKHTPRYFFENKGKPKGIDDVWGTSQITEDDIAIAGLSTAFYQLSLADKDILILLRELFRTKQKRGKLADVKVGRGLPTLADDLLPRKDTRRNLIDSPVIEHLKDFWRRDEKDSLEKLAMLVPLGDFKKLHFDSSYKRILEAFWRASRDDFSIERLINLKRRINEIISKLEDIQKVGEKAKKEFELNINFDEKDENVVESLEGLKELTGLSFSGKLSNFIHQLYLDATLFRIERLTLELYTDIQRINGKLDDLKENVSQTVESLKNERGVLDFISDKFSYEQLKQEIENLINFDNDLSIQDIESELRDRISSVETLLSKFGGLETKLNDLIEKLSNQNLVEV